MEVELVNEREKAHAGVNARADIVKLQTEVDVVKEQRQRARDELEENKKRITLLEQRCKDVENSKVQELLNLRLTYETQITSLEDRLMDME